MSQLNNIFKIMNGGGIILEHVKLENIVDKYNNENSKIKLTDYRVSKQLTNIKGKTKTEQFQQCHMKEILKS